MSDYSYQEINLRPYLEAVLRKWYWILGLGLLAGILAYAATNLLIAPTYEATALVSIIEPRQRVQFDPRIVTVEENQPYRAYPEIATSDELLVTLGNQTAVGSFTVPQLRGMLTASAGNDPSLLRLTAENADPEVASGLANEWAALFVSWANRTYGDSSADQLAFFEQRLEEATVDLEASQNALIAYQAQNRTAILDNELEALQQIHATLLSKEGEIEILSSDIDSLLATSAGMANESHLANDGVTALILKLRAFGGSISGDATAVPLQLQMNVERLAAENSLTPEEQIFGLQASLELQTEQTAASLAEIEPQILDVQVEREEALATESLLLRNVELAGDTYTALARTVEEKRITSQDTNTGITLASRSSVPAFPTGPRTSFYVLAAFIGAAMLVTFLIILITWWGLSNDAMPTVAAGTRIENATENG